MHRIFEYNAINSRKGPFLFENSYISQTLSRLAFVEKECQDIFGKDHRRSNWYSSLTRFHHLYASRTTYHFFRTSRTIVKNTIEISDHSPTFLRFWAAQPAICHGRVRPRSYIPCHRGSRRTKMKYRLQEGCQSGNHPSDDENRYETVIAIARASVH